ncbi:MAG: M24 family metallopeptidase, partial [Candidatus Thorarchaeota archaeon]
MSQEPTGAHKQAGKIAAKVRDETAEKLEPGMEILEVCEYAESRITELGGKPAFPCNVSINHIAAHYTSPRDDESILPDSGLVKIDIGVHVDGYIADTARTVDMTRELEGFIAATDDALQEAIELMQPGTS